MQTLRTLGAAVGLALIAGSAWAQNALLEPDFWKDADLAAVQAAVEAGADPLETTEDQFFPLYRALEAGAGLEVVQYLVEAGTDPSKQGNDATPILLAARNTPLEVVQYLVEQGADLGHADDSWRDAMNFGAGGTVHVDVMQYLIDQGMNPDTQDINGRTPAFTAARLNSNFEVVKFLSTASDIKVIDVNGNNALMWSALRNTNPEVVKYVYDLVDDPMLKNEDGRDALMLSAIRNRKTTEVPAFFLEKGFDVNAADKTGRTPLSLAADDNNAAAIELFVSAGADVGAADADGKTPLHYAAAKNTPEVVSALIAAGADVNAAAADGATPLTLASAREDGADVVKVLTEAGAK